MSKTLIIAEAGKNFIVNKDQTSVSFTLENAKALARAAKEAGADVVKFQCHVFKDEAKKRADSRHDWIKMNERLTPFNGFWKPLKEYCDNIGITFLVTPMSKLAAIKINPLVGMWKVGSADVVDIPLLEYLKETGKPVIMSTGMCTGEQVVKAIGILGSSLYALLHCTSIYPCPIEKTNLNTLTALKSYWKGTIGFSDHTTNPIASYCAVAMGATIIEKHFTLHKYVYGYDHSFSLLPDSFEIMVGGIREVEKMLGEPSLESEEIKLWGKYRL